MRLEQDFKLKINYFKNVSNIFETFWFYKTIKIPTSIFMKNSTSYLYKPVEDKTITWFENSNEYLVLENTTADILKRLSKGVSIQ